MDTLDTELGLPEQTAAPSQQLQKGLVDTRQLGKPEKISGDPGSFEDRSFVFEAYMSCVDRRYIALFDRVRFSDTPWSNRMMTGVECELSVQLYYTLAMLLQGRALDTCQTAGLGRGLRNVSATGGRIQTPSRKQIRGNPHANVIHEVLHGCRSGPASV